jgi:hypothetical protein
MSLSKPRVARGPPVRRLLAWGGVVCKWPRAGVHSQAILQIAVLASIVKDTPPAVIDVKPRAAKEFCRDLSERCLAKDPARRYHRCWMCGIDLGRSKRICVASSIGGTPADAPQLGRAVVPWLVAAVATLAVVLILLLRPEPVEWNGVQLGATSVAFDPPGSRQTASSSTFLALVERPDASGRHGRRGGQSDRPHDRPYTGQINNCAGRVTARESTSIEILQAQVPCTQSPPLAVLRRN